MCHFRDHDGRRPPLAYHQVGAVWPEAIIIQYEILLAVFYIHPAVTTLTMACSRIYQTATVQQNAESTSIISNANHYSIYMPLEGRLENAALCKHDGGNFSLTKKCPFLVK